MDENKLENLLSEANDHVREILFDAGVLCEVWKIDNNSNYSLSDLISMANLLIESEKLLKE